MRTLSMRLKLFIVLLCMAGFALVGGCGASNGGGGGSNSSVGAPAAPGGGPSGQGGSTARFAIANNYLYTLSGYKLNIYDIEIPNEPRSMRSVSLDWNIETIFAYNNNLFVGSTTGLFIYDISSRPELPKFLSQFRHARSCDPVVVQDGTAYVTLRNTPVCRGTTNRLDILNVNDVKAPFVIQSYEMYAPYGLAIDKNYLFICDGDAGLLLYDVTDRSNIKEKDRARRLVCSDVIARNNLLIATGDTGITQLDYATGLMTELSKIPILKKSSR